MLVALYLDGENSQDIAVALLEYSNSLVHNMNRLFYTAKEDAEIKATYDAMYKEYQRIEALYHDVLRAMGDAEALYNVVR